MLKTITGAVTSFFSGGAGIQTYIMAALAAVIVVLGVAGWFLLGRLEDSNKQIGELNGAVTTAVAAARGNAAVVDEVLAASRMETDALTRERDAALLRAKRVRRIYQDITNAPQSENGPVAPVLSRTLDGLRQRAPGSGAGTTPGP